MCYTGKATASKKVRIAKKNINVFKFGVFKGDGKVYPYFMQSSDVTYQEGNEYNAKIIPEFGTSSGGNAIIVHAGLHSFAKSRAYISNLPDPDGRTIASVHYKLFPLALTYDFWNSKDNILVLMKCHIPKGTKYLMDWYGHTVSESLVVDEIIKL